MNYNHMKISIPKEANAVEALQCVCDFLKENTVEYDRLRTDMTISFTLKTPDGKVCPLNDGIFTLKNKSVVDISLELKEHAKAVCLERMNKNIYEFREEVADLEREIRRSEKYLATAKRKNLGTIEHWEERVQDLHHEKETLLPKLLTKYSLLERCVKEGKITWSFHIAHNSKKKEIRVRPTFDSDCTITKNPLYFYYQDGYHNYFTTDDLTEEHWLKVSVNSKK